MQQFAGPRLQPILADVERLAGRPVGTPHELEALLRQIYHTLADIDLEALPLETIKSEAPLIMHGLFRMRIHLRERIADWQARKLLLRPAEVALRDVFRLMRYAVDMLGEVAIGNTRLGPDERARRAFTGRDYNTQVNPAFYDGKNIPFQSGDVLLVRGNAHNSAAIARIGDVDTQFSHTAIIYVDPEGKPWVVEALIEDGSVINTLESVLDHGVGRAVLFRFKDPAIAVKAAEIAYQRISRSLRGWGGRIPYDFSMRLTGRHSLFCAKLVQQAYLDASRGKVVLPAYMTRFDQRNRRFYQSIGVKTRDTYAPADIDLDPRFDLVAEWQDYRATPRLRRQDMMMTAFFDWMENRGWRFKGDWLIFLISVFGRMSSYLSEGVKDLLASVVPKVPRSMKRRTIAAIAMLHKTAEELMPSLEALDVDHVRMTGKPIHPRALLAHLERLRQVSGGRIRYLVGKV